jgi:SCY1-like protein 2
MVRVLPEFSTRLMKQKLLPKLLEELKDKQLIPFILPNLFWILDRVEPHEFVSIALPRLKGIFRMIDPPQTIILLLSRMNLFLAKVTDQATFRDEILPLLYTGLEVSDVPHVQEQALKVT